MFALNETSVVKTPLVVRRKTVPKPSGTLLGSRSIEIATAVHDQLALGITAVSPVEGGQRCQGSIGPETAIRRRYATTLVRSRIHQQAFRERVVAAYCSQCAMCRLRYASLLDAAHIVPDSEEGEPKVSNGLALCKLHHAAFDSFLVSVTPDYDIQVRASVLEEEDGPMLEHGLKGLQGVVIQLPSRSSEHPDRGSLARHFDKFRSAA